MPYSHPDAWCAEQLKQLARQSVLRGIVERTGAQGREIWWDGKSYLNFGSNDYLGLAADPRLAAAAQQAAHETGWGSGASPLVSGRSSFQACLENDLARFEGTESALVFPSGYAANIGVLTALSDRSAQVFSDAKNHASIIDACRLCGGTVRIYRHGDVCDLERQLRSEPQADHRRLIVTDGLFSMDGDLAPLQDLHDLAEKHDAWLIVDEAHATGVFGEKGRGTCEVLGVESPRVVRIGTLSKALGSIGGFVAGSHSLISWIANRARTFVFSTALPGPCLAAASASLRIIQEEPQRRCELLRRADELRQALRRLGCDIGMSSSQIVPVVMGSPEQAIASGSALRNLGIYVPVIRPPSVPVGESLLRISLSYQHCEEDIERLVEALTAATLEGWQR